MALETLEELTIAIYARFSSSKQRDTSIEDQIALCREYIVRHGGTVREWYAEGQPLRSIATLLNDVGIAPPRAKSKQGVEKFWRKSTLSILLCNRTYLGEFTFGRRKWGKRVYTRQTVFQTDTRPHLAIAPQDLWSAVAARKAGVANNLTGKRGHSGRKTAHPYAGLLFCGVCGSSFMDVGGSATRYYRCRGAVEGGKCNNLLPVREDLLNDVAMSELRALLGDTKTWDKIQREISERMKTERFDVVDERSKLTREIQNAETAIDRLVHFITSTEPASASYGLIRTKLDTAAQQKKEAELALASLEDAPEEAPRLPTADEAMAMCRDLEARVKGDPVGFREFMRSTFLADGKITLDPQPDGTYSARSRILPLRVPVARPIKTRTPETVVVPGASGLVGPVRCGGWI
jgi:site-specific DNA recombinase